MSSKRNAAMAAMQASIDTHAAGQDPLVINEDIELDEAAGVQSQKEQVQAQTQAEDKTEADIERMEAAKDKASSEAVKEKMDEEIDRGKKKKKKKEEEPPPPVSILTPIGKVNDQAWKTIDRVRDVASEGWHTLGRVSTPGTIFLPVAILLIFFFLLLPINGYTRAQWLWLALTGDAHISPSGGQTVSPPVTPATPVTPPIPGGTPAAPITPTIPGSTFTGVGL